MHVIQNFRVTRVCDRELKLAHSHISDINTNSFLLHLNQRLRNFCFTHVRAQNGVS